MPTVLTGLWLKYMKKSAKIRRKRPYKSKKTKVTAQRNTYRISKSKKRLLRRFQPKRTRTPKQGDLRRWAPATANKLTHADGTQIVRLVSTIRNPGNLLRNVLPLDKISFQDPIRTMVCKRRKARRESLFSLKKIGKGKGVSKIRRMNPLSKIRC